MVLWGLSMHAISLPQLSSFPSARATIFLDFGGTTVISSSWNNGNPINCAPAGMTDAQITETFNRVSEDYRPFNINITTDINIFLQAPLIARMRVIITPTSSWFASGFGGVAITGTFKTGDDTPCFVFCDRLTTFPKYIAECCTHESGHTVGLSHQSSYNSSCTLVATYNTGAGSGEIGWAPVMGNSYYKNITTWNNGPTPSGCSASQDNLSIITTQNGFTYRTDEHGDDININPTVLSITNQVISANGIITTNTDKDAFKIVLPTNGMFHLDAVPYSVGANLEGANLDIKLSFYNSSKQLINTYNPSTLLSAVIDTSLTAGTYYVVLDGAGNTNTSNYGSLGAYTISGTFSPAAALPIRDVALSGKIDRSLHTLSWNIISDDPIKTLELQSSTDGRNFTTLTMPSVNLKSYTYEPSVKSDIFYRLKATSTVYQIVQSNIITLKANSVTATAAAFKVSTIVHNDITVNATENYHYQLSDISGRVVEKGKSPSGMNTVNMSNHPNGLYIMEIISINQRITERIIKQ